MNVTECKSLKFRVVIMDNINLFNQILSEGCSGITLASKVKNWEHKFKNSPIGGGVIIHGP